MQREGVLKGSNSLFVAVNNDRKTPVESYNVRLSRQSCGIHVQVNRGSGVKLERAYPNTFLHSPNSGITSDSRYESLTMI